LLDGRWGCSVNRAKGLLPLAEVVKRLLIEKKMNQLQLVELMDGKVKQSNLSAALSGKRNFTLAMLDAITEALGLERGALYTYFVPECFDRYGNLRPKKTVEFILRCYHLELQTVVDRLAEELIAFGKKNADILFALAEQLNDRGMNQEALTYYHAVVELERGQLPESERWLISLCRVFQILKDKKHPGTYEAAIHLHTYLRDLSDHSEHGLLADVQEMKIAAYHSLLSYYLEREKWEKVIETCTDYLQIVREDHRDHHYKEAVMMQCEAYSQLQQHDLAMKAAEEYLLEQRSGKADMEVYFQLLRYREKTGKGEVPSISGYVAWVKRNQLYLLPSLPHLLVVCLEKQRWRELEQLLASLDIPTTLTQVEVGMFRMESIFLRIQRYLALYFLQIKDMGEATKRLLTAMELAVSQQAYRELIACVMVYHEFSDETKNEIGAQVDSLLSKAVQQAN